MMTEQGDDDDRAQGDDRAREMTMTAGGGDDRAGG